MTVQHLNWDLHKPRRRAAYKIVSQFEAEVGRIWRISCPVAISWSYINGM